MKTTADDAKTCLSDVINNISSIRTIHNINHAVLETGVMRIFLIISLGTFSSYEYLFQANQKNGLKYYNNYI